MLYKILRLMNKRNHRFLWSDREENVVLGFEKELIIPENSDNMSFYLKPLLTLTPVVMKLIQIISKIDIKLYFMILIPTISMIAISVRFIKLIQIFLQIDIDTCFMKLLVLFQIILKIDISAFIMKLIQIISEFETETLFVKLTNTTTNKLIDIGNKIMTLFEF